MKASIQKQILKIDKNLKLTCYNRDKKKVMARRKVFLKQCLIQPVKMLSEIELKSMFKFIYGTDDDQKHTSNNDLH